MRPDDETREPDEHEEGAPAEPGDGADAGEHEAPPPATYAGRQRAEQAEGEGDQGGEGGPGDGEPGDGFTEEFDEIERDLDEELAGLAEPETADEPEAEAEPGGDELDEAEPEPAELDDEDLDPADDELEVDDPGDDDGHDGEELAEEPDSAAPEAPSHETVEAETVALADKAEAEEAALAGLRARAAKKPGASAPPPASAAPEEQPEPVVAATADEPAEEEPKKGKTPRAKRLWARFATGSVMIVASIAAATSISLLVYLTDIAADLSDNDALAGLRPDLDRGRRRRPADDPDPRLRQAPRHQGRSGQVRHDDAPAGRSRQGARSRCSRSRATCEVNIPGVGVDKFNAAYSAGGPEKTLKVVKQLTGVPIHHVVNINFTGFADAVNAIGCVYVDVDRRYYIPEEDGTSEINLEAGYQRMCGFNALAYVRFRHFDNDLVRAARQQDFLREARQKLPPEKLIEDRNELLDIFTEYTTSDIGEAVQLLELLKTFARGAVGAGDRGPLPGRARNDLRDRERRRDPGGGAAVPGGRGDPRRAPGRRAAAARRGRPERRLRGRGQAAGWRQAAGRRRPEARGGEAGERLRRAGDGRLDRDGPDLREAGVGEAQERRRPDGRLPGLLPDPARARLVHRPRQSARS